MAVFRRIRPRHISLLRLVADGQTEHHRARLWPGSPALGWFLRGQARRNASFDSTGSSDGVYENVAALFCMPLRCTAFDCDGEGARTP